MLALFGFCMALAYNAPWYVWLIGFFCLLMDVHQLMDSN